MFAVLAPAAFGLGILAAIPLVIHLLSRRRAAVRVFPTAALLARIEVGRSQRRRLREHATLALRTLAILAAVLAAAGLTWQGSFLGGNAPAVIVLDASASMRQVTASGGTAFDRARAAAGQLADRLSGRTLMLVIASQPPLVFGDATQGAAKGVIASALAEAVVGFGDGDPTAAIAQAVALLPQGGECFFVSDLARGSLAGIDPAALPSGVRLHLVDAGGGAANLAVVGLACEPGVALAGKPVTVMARVANYSSRSARVGVTLRVGSQVHLEQLELSAGGSAVVSTTVTIDAVGAVALEAELAGELPDALPVDDRRTGCLHVLPGLPVVLASDGDRDDPAGVVRPLSAALGAAGLDARHSDRAGIASEVIAAGGPSLLITAGLAEGADLGPRLKAHLESGGAWLQVVSSAADAAITISGVVPPVRLGDRLDVSDQERGVMTVAQARMDHALFAPFQGRESLLTSVAAWRFRLTPQPPAADAVALWAYADGTIALAERPVGAGRWLMLNCSPAAADGNLGRGEVLPLLMARLPSVLLPARDDHLAMNAGSEVAVAAALEGPDGRGMSLIDGRARLHQPGIYRLVGGGLIAAAIPALESDLTQVDPTVLGLAKQDAVTAISSVAATPLWSWMLALVAVALTAEMVLAGGLPGVRR